MKMTESQADWYLNAFIVDYAQGEINALKIVWPRSVILLCLWHVRRAWQKQACAKITALALHAAVLEDMGSVMYDREGPRGPDAEPWAMLKIMHLSKKYPLATDFWHYVEEQWLFWAHMWVVGYRELPYPGQDTNAAIEGYHSTLKAMLKSGKCHMLGHKVDWLIHELTQKVLTHFWYQCLRKRFGFVINKRQEYIVVGALLKARNIPDVNVTLPSEAGAPAIERSCTKPHLMYIVFNLGSEWACCTCSQANRGYICKHKLKVLRMLKPDLREGSIARLCGSLKGTIHGGEGKLLADKHVNTVPSMHTVETYSTDSLGAEGDDLNMDRDEIEGQVRSIVHHMLEDADGNDVLLRHLLAGILRLKGSQSRLAVDIESGTLHPSQAVPEFQTVDDGSGFSLKRRRDFLERR